jgi:rare lipoprotein A
MMNKHFAVVFVAISTFIAALPCGGAARASGRSHDAAVQDDATAWVSETGTASYYGPVYHGRRSASGVRFDQEALTAAHPWLPFGTRVKVTLAGTRRSVIVTITDRLYSTRRIVDLSVAAARQLGMISRGIAEVTLLPT